MQNYGELKAAIADYLDREDMASRLPNFIRLAETKIYRQLRSRDTEFTQVWTEADTLDNPIPLPQNFKEVKTLILNGETLQHVSASMLDKYSDTGTARVFALVERELILHPGFTPPYDGEITLELLYYGTESITQMTPWDHPTNPNSVPESQGTASTTTERGDEATTRLFLTAPDLYLYGALVEAYMFLREPAKAAEWSPGFNEVLQRLQYESDSAELTGVTAGVASVYHDGGL
jgi:hypothetical protein